MVEKILSLLLPKEKLVIEPHHLPTILNYQRRISRCTVPPEIETEAEVRGPFPMMFVTDRPGRYVGNGYRITWTIR